MSSMPSLVQPASGRRFQVLRRCVIAPVRRLFGTVVRVQTDQPVVALTFDDGPDPVSLPLLLALLERHHARATFFVLGASAQRYPQLIRQILAEGHVIGNHTFSHSYLPGLRGAERRREIRACRQAIGAHESALLRPPWGYQSLGSRFDALFCGYEVVGWSVEVMDWKRRTPVELLDDLEHQTRPGDIVLLHDAIHLTGSEGNLEVMRDRSAMLSALDAFLERAQRRFRFVTIPELMASGKPLRRSWIRIKPAHG